MIVVASYVGFTGFKNSAFPSIVRFLMKLSNVGAWEFQKFAEQRILSG